MSEIGMLIGGRYEIIKKIGQGGMSVVYLVKENSDNKQWAVKAVEKCSNGGNNEVVIQSLLTEAKMIKKLDHRDLPQIIDVIEDENTIYLVMEYIEGKPLDQVIEQEGAQSQEYVIKWAMQLCGVLNYLHSQKPQIIYRDMKPANIMLKSDGSIKVVDLGIAREYKEENFNDTINLGTRGYAAPEQFAGNGQTDVRTDIFCLGVTLYHLVTGMNPCEPPYEIFPIRHWNPELSECLEKIILKCTQRNPEDRYQNCAEIMYELNHYKEFDKVNRKKKINKIKRVLLFFVISIIVGAAGVASSKFNVENSIYLIFFAVCCFIISIILSFRYKIFNLIKESSKKSTKVSSQRIEGNSETTMLEIENETTILDIENETTILDIENETTILDIENETTVLDIESEESIDAVDRGTQILVESYDLLANEVLEKKTEFEKDTAILEVISKEKENTASRKSQIIENKVGYKNRELKSKKSDSISNKVVNLKTKIDGFEIIESITLINSKEEIV